MEYYVGITIGPIIETLTCASRPAALWCASSMFSWLSEDLCNGLIRRDFSIISPYYPETRPSDRYSTIAEKAGKYHDRIIGLTEAESIEAIKACVDEVIEQSKKHLSEILTKPFKDEKELEQIQQIQTTLIQYLQVHYIVEEKVKNASENCILRLSPYLDAAELCPTFIADQSLQPILALFEGKDDNDRNAYLKKCFSIDNGHTTLLHDNSIRDIEHIANSCPNDKRKIFNYYAIVQADGDNIGELLRNLHTDDEVTSFSRICLEYTTKVADRISAFGGVVIYAGGDDLLFLAPVENIKSQNIFVLCNEIANDFRSAFVNANYQNAPTLSIGISINYKYFPLYEALSDAIDMLAESKNVPNQEEKNKTTVHIRKSSGQSAKFRYTNNSDVFNQFEKLLKQQNDVGILQSMLYKIDLYRPILLAALTKRRKLPDVFQNLFDSEYNCTVKRYIDIVSSALEVIYQYIQNAPNESFALEKIAVKSAKSNEEKAIDLLYSLLRTARFLTEKRR